MESLISTIEEKINSGLSFDMELLLDQTIDAVAQAKATQKEELHTLGQGFQRFYDAHVNKLKELILSEIQTLKSQSRNECNCDTPQRIYRLLKLLLSILNEIPTVF
jgi:hypothetical protein